MFYANRLERGLHEHAGNPRWLERRAVPLATAIFYSRDCSTVAKEPNGEVWSLIQYAIKDSYAQKEYYADGDQKTWPVG